MDPKTSAKAAQAQEEERARVQAVRDALPPVETILGLDEFQVSLPSFFPWMGCRLIVQDVAGEIMSKKAGEYYHGGSLDGISRDSNRSSFRRCRLIPRVMRDVSTVAPQTTIFGVPSALPIYISPASNALLGHPDGELNLTRGVSA